MLSHKNPDHAISVLQLAPSQLCMHFPFPSIHATCTIHLIVLDSDQLNNVWKKEDIMELLIRQLSPLSYYFLPLRLKYLLQYPSDQHLPAM